MSYMPPAGAGYDPTSVKYMSAQAEKAKAEAAKSNADAEKARAIADAQRAKTEAARLEHTLQQEKLAEKQAARLEKRFVEAKQAFLTAQTRDEQRTALKRLTQFAEGQEFVLETLYQNDGLDPKLKLQALSDVLQSSEPHSGTYKRAMNMLPVAIYDHSESQGYVSSTGPNAAQAQDFEQRLQKMSNISHKKPIKAQRALTKEVNMLARDLDIAPALRYQEKSEFATKALKLLAEKNTRWFDVNFQVDSFFNRRSRFDFNEAIQTLLKHI